MGHNFGSNPGQFTSGAGSWADQWTTITNVPTHLTSATSQSNRNSQAAQFGFLHPSLALQHTISAPYTQLQRRPNAKLHQPMDDRSTPPMVARPLSHYEQLLGPYRNTVDTLAGVDPALFHLASNQLPVVNDGEGTSLRETFRDPDGGNLSRSALSYAEIAHLPSQAVHQHPYQPSNRMPMYPNASILTTPGPTWQHQDNVAQQTPVQLSMHWQPHVVPPLATRRAARHKYRTRYTPPTQADAPPWPSTPSGRAPSRAQRQVPMTRSGSKAGSSTTSGRRSKQHTMSTVSEHVCFMCGASFERLTSKA
ncbi:hypothetical protein LTR82_003316 [Friedmanniomyces endolithicus]|uniref:Uncharacterized protein n=1 Tax=Friedmanniomyces endolithicus TaxID=329885 RepID=A0AAN6JCX9_9PEZI|nr:hypothetical protein LTR82_003316 [Friedmanniomyces endolithicus]